LASAGSASAALASAVDASLKENSKRRIERSAALRPSRRPSG
jgi:hypothetical protein